MSQKETATANMKPNCAEVKSSAESLDTGTITADDDDFLLIVDTDRDVLNGKLVLLNAEETMTKLSKTVKSILQKGGGKDISPGNASLAAASVTNSIHEMKRMTPKKIAQDDRNDEYGSGKSFKRQKYS